MRQPGNTHARDVPRGRIQTFQVPDRLVGVGIIISQETAAVFLRKHARETNRRHRFDIEQIDHQQVARFRAFDVERPRQRMRARQVDVPDVSDVVGVLDLCIEKIQRFNQYRFARLDRRQERQVGMPAVVSQFRLLCQRYAWLDLEVLHATLLVVWFRWFVRGNADAGSDYGLLVRYARHRTLRRAGSLARDRFDLSTCSLRIVDPGLVEVERAIGNASGRFAGIDLAGIAAVQKFEEVVLRLPVAARITDGADRQLGILNAHFLGLAFAQRAPVEADNRRMAEIGIHAVKTGGIGDGNVDVIHPCHRLGDQHLLILGGVHVALATHDQFGALHGAVAPDFRIIAIVADDQTDFESLGSIADISGVAGIPAFDRRPGHDLAILLHNLALVVDQDQRVVRRLARMFFMTLAGQRKHAPDVGNATGLGKYAGLFARYGGGSIVHFLLVI